MAKTVRGNFDPEQIRGDWRQGDSKIIQMAKAETPTAGNVPVYDTDGSLKDSGSTPAGGTGGVPVQTDMTASRAFAAVYQNTGVYPLLVVVTASAAAAGTNTAYTDGSNPPTTAVCAQTVTLNVAQTRHVAFVVLPNNYYKVTTDTAATVGSWIEWALPTGVAGRDATWRVGNADPPADALGVDADMYLTTTNGKVWQRAAGSYLLMCNITGPTGAAGAGGGLILLESHTASGSTSLDFTTRNAAGMSGATIQADFDEYEIHFVNLVPASTNVSFQMRMSTDGGATYDAGASAYKYGMLYSGIGDTPTQSTGNGVSAIDLAHSISTQAGYSTNGKIGLFNPGGSAYKFIEGKVQSVVGAGNVYQWGDSGVYLSTTAVNAFRFLFSSGNIASGTIRVYGLAK